MINNINSAIIMTRGDDVAIHVNITSIASDGTETEYTMQEGDRLIFTVKYNSEYGNAEALIQKTFTTANITIDHDDTKDLEYGLYLYDIVLVDSNDKIYTLLMNTLELTKEGGI